MKYWLIAASAICLQYILSFGLSAITSFHELAFFIMLIPWAGYMCLQVDRWNRYDKAIPKRKPLKSGIHSDGRPYLDISDPYTANAIRDAAEKFRGIKCS